ncbi:MAG: hypothetical protein JNG88_01795 [Phycisphaerales bacterium]|nr:hypothetical protein [Phycisphaerales bacterium]
MHSNCLTARAMHHARISALFLAIGAAALLIGGCPFTRFDSDEFDDANEPGDVDAASTAALPDTVPDFASARFSRSSVIDNAYFPLPPGRVLTYRSVSGDEEIVVEVLATTRDVAGITCRAVRDRVYKDGRVVEDTFDWYAQDDGGNVWYMGEDVTDFVYDNSGNLLSSEHPGSWETNKDVANIGVTALPGFIMPAHPTTGDRYHQEYYVGEAEDYAEVVGVGVEVALADGSTHTTIKTHDLSTLDNTIDSFKYYAVGVGVVLEEGHDGERVELISITGS